MRYVLTFIILCLYVSAHAVTDEQRQIVIDQCDPDSLDRSVIKACMLVELTEEPIYWVKDSNGQDIGQAFKMTENTYHIHYDVGNNKTVILRTTQKDGNSITAVPLNLLSYGIYRDSSCTGTNWALSVPLQAENDLAVVVFPDETMDVYSVDLTPDYLERWYVLDDRNNCVPTNDRYYRVLNLVYGSVAPPLDNLTIERR